MAKASGTTTYENVRSVDNFAIPLCPGVAVILYKMSIPTDRTETNSPLSVLGKINGFCVRKVSFPEKNRKTPLP